MSEASAQVRIYDPSTSVVFLKTNEKFGGLSNMAPGYPLEVNGIAIRTSEALYQALRFPHMPDLQRVIIDEASPMTAKMRTKPHRENSREDWDRVRVKIMRWCLQVKLAQNIDSFGKLLLSTGDAPIVEYSKKDQFWGAEPGEDGRLVGMNVLGRLLMELREQFHSNGPEWVAKIDPLPIDHFDLLSRHIEPVFARWSRSAETAVEARATTKRVPQEDLFSSIAEPSSAGERVAVDQVVPAVVSLPQYPEMRDTGLAWLPRAPARWGLWRNGRLFGPRRETGYPDLPILEVSLRSGVRVRDMETGRKQQMADRSKYLRAREGDIAYNMMRMWQGAVGVVPTDGLVSPAYVVARPFAEAYAPYYAYLFRTAAYMGEVDNYSRGIVKDRNRLYWESFKQIVSAVPPLEEQWAIVRFLDWHGNLTANLIRAKRRLIALLNEQKQAIVHRAVTRGLDPNARLVPSGVPWLGDVRKGWPIAALRHRYHQCLGKMLDEKTITGKYLLPYLRNTDVQWDRINTTDLPSMDIPTAEYPRYTVRHGDLLVCEGGEVGRAAIWTNDSATIGFQKALHRLRAIYPDKEVPRFLYYQLRVAVMEGAFQDGHESTIAHLTAEKIRRHRFVFPTKQEQLDIVEFLDRECGRIDNAIGTEHHEIGLLHELRVRLISDAVTGQLDVRDIAAKLPEVEPRELDSEPNGAEDELAAEADGDVEEAA